MTWVLRSVRSCECNVLVETTRVLGLDSHLLVLVSVYRKVVIGHEVANSKVSSFVRR